jgi:hypothetical protein
VAAVSARAGRRSRLLVTALAALSSLAASACQRDAAPDARGASAPPPATRSAASTADGATPCVLADRWQPCYLEKRLENSGLVPVLLDSAVTLPMFNRPARHYRLGRGELYVVLYADDAARRADLATVDSLSVSRRGAERYAWPMPPFLAVSSNAAAVLLTNSEHLTVRIEDIFTGGLPRLTPR